MTIKGELMVKKCLSIISILFFLFSFTSFGQNNIIEVVGGFDGANPQSQEDIIREASNRFRLKSSVK